MMVARLLRMDNPPRPADSADALALAICHLWRGGAQRRLATAATTARQVTAARQAAAARQVAARQVAARQVVARQVAAARGGAR